jgi:hypothetical protein
MIRFWVALVALAVIALPLSQALAGPAYGGI